MPSLMAPNEFYCVSCKKRITLKTKDIRMKVLTNGNPAKSGICHECNTSLFKFTSKANWDSDLKKYGACAC